MELSKHGTSITQVLLDTIGPFDPILGSIGIYAIWLWYGNEAVSLFHSTQSPLVDAGLLIFGATLLGKSISLLVDFVLAAVQGWTQKRDTFHLFTELKESILRYSEATKRTEEVKNTNEFDVAAALIAIDSPSQHLTVSRIRANARMAYSFAFLLTPYLAYLWRENAPKAMTIGIMVGIIVLAIKGYLEQLDYYHTLALKLRLLRSTHSQQDPNEEEVD